MPTARLEVAEPEQRDGWVRLSARLTPPHGDPRDVWFEFESPDGLLPPRRARPFVLAFLPVAMRHGWTLRCEDPLDRETLGNLAHWQAVFAHWFPWSLEQVDIEAREAGDVRPGLGGSAMGFSGGVDSTEVLVQRGLFPENGRPRISAGVLIHGFDIPLAETAGYDERWRAARRQLERFGATGLRLRTNVRALARRPYLDWAREVHGIWLGAALSCLEPWYGELIMAASDIDRRLSLPWASNPLTDRLLGGQAARVTNEGGGRTRLEKLAFLAEAGALDDLRVCYERPSSGRNCGRCAKCLLLRLGLETLGLDAERLFPTPDDAFRRGFRTALVHQVDGLNEMAAQAEAVGRAGLARELRGMVAARPWASGIDLMRRWVRRVR